jgi:hypothetical protein
VGLLSRLFSRWKALTVARRALDVAHKAWPAGPRFAHGVALNVGGCILRASFAPNGVEVLEVWILDPRACCVLCVAFSERPLVEHYAPGAWERQLRRALRVTLPPATAWGQWR